MLKTCGGEAQVNNRRKQWPNNNLLTNYIYTSTRTHTTHTHTVYIYETLQASVSLRSTSSYTSATSSSNNLLLNYIYRTKSKQMFCTCSGCHKVNKPLEVYCEHHCSVVLVGLFLESENVRRCRDWVAGHTETWRACPTTHTDILSAYQPMDGVQQSWKVLNYNNIVCTLTLYKKQNASVIPLFL